MAPAKTCRPHYRTPCQRRNADAGVQHSLPDACLGHIGGDLTKEGGNHAHERTRSESIRQAERDVDGRGTGRKKRAWNPQDKDDEG
ncbi:hypothetical protein PRK78_005211 [Emydomyces testavorans]|uniref:Uncharacterized protein n=1 Tax=Emydomyces testavorans TaxID=2070801 RepID=A0AAF0DJ80_9EURO|nr:hypothetical protein PRK78_005211 [Emydomyces testavorans]